MPLLRKTSHFLLRWGHRVFKRDYVPLLKFLPPSPFEGEGGLRGMGLE
jgi:hypothetical protein